MRVKFNVPEAKPSNIEAETQAGMQVLEHEGNPSADSAIGIGYVSLIDEFGCLELCAQQQPIVNLVTSQLLEKPLTLPLRSEEMFVWPLESEACGLSFRSAIV